MRGSFRRGKKAPPGKESQGAKKLLEGPLHDENYIQQEHKKSPFPLKSFILEVPRSHLNNFTATVTGKVPNYVTVQGTLMVGDRKVTVNRQVVRPSFSSVYQQTSM
jgi:small subunit ribosomal protein S24e